jgi:hypothetical protein
MVSNLDPNYIEGMQYDDIEDDIYQQNLQMAQQMSQISAPTHLQKNYVFGGSADFNMGLQ